MNKFSIVVCAYNAAQRLPATLEHIAKLDYPNDHVEIVVIDNNSNDGTSDLARSLWNKLGSPFELSVVIERQQGLSHARKRGIFSAKFDLILFCDDDNWLQGDYLLCADAVLRNQPALGVLGGQGIPVTDAPELPNWFYTYASDYATGVQAIDSGDISSRGYVWGAAAIVKKRLLVEALSRGLDFLLTDRNGTNLTSGGDSEICKWFLIAGYRLWYDETLVFKHFIPQNRLSREYLPKLFIGFDRAAPILFEYDKLIALRRARHNRWRYPINWLRSEFSYYRDRSKTRCDVAKTGKKIIKISAAFKLN